MYRHFRFISLITISTISLFYIGCKQSSLAIETEPITAQLPHNIHDVLYPLPVKPAISAHRGGKHIDNYPENCLETFVHISKDHNLIIECDVAQTKDGRLIFMHDDAIDRTTNGTGKVVNLDWVEIENLILKDHRGEDTEFGVPTLSEVLSWAKGHAILSLDIKRSVDRALLIEELKKHNADEFSEIITYNFESAKYYSENAPAYRLSVGIRNMEELERYLSSDIPLHNLKPFVGTRRKDADFYSKLHEHNMIVTLGTLGNIDEQAKAKGFHVYEKLIEEGVDVFATDDPLEVAEYFYK